jgi:anthranilate phosphoribosyltransferase
MNVLEGKGTEEQHAAVIANSAMALYCVNRGEGLSKAVEKAEHALRSGKALESFKKLMNA